MTTPPTDRDHPATDGAGREPGIRPENRSAAAPGPADGESQLREVLGPFVAWLATQDLDEPPRRRHRDAAERYLRWSRIDAGPLEDRRHRYERHLLEHDPGHVADSRSGLDWWGRHRQILARMMPPDR